MNNNIQPSKDVKNISEKKDTLLKTIIGMAVMVAFISFGFGSYQLATTNAISIEERQASLLNQIRETAIQICEQDKAILEDQVEGGKNLNLDVSKHSSVMKNLEKPENCYSHIGDILSGRKTLGKY
jgi:hypothetical protein